MGKEAPQESRRVPGDTLGECVPSSGSISKRGTREESIEEGGENSDEMGRNGAGGEETEGK
ncbi:MAG: hypothetical protein D6795_15735 [Deltaproteobacteria bacterium]|nr:MAG: hypothetical protein D6795_15735 [Deltaproteobacteria bacterium]